MVFTDWRQWPNLCGVLESSNLRLNQMVVWNKCVMGLGNGFRAQHELIAHTSKGVPKIADRSSGNVLSHKRVDNADHPSPKPVSLLVDLVRVCEGDSILDPFMGSGTTLVAAKNLGRKAIGIELEEKYCAVAVERLRQDVLPLAGGM